MGKTVSGHICRLGSVGLSMTNATVTMASPRTVTVGHIHRCHHHGRAVTRSVTGIASWTVSPVKIANNGPRPG